MEQALQNNIRLLTNVRANPSTKPEVLTRLKERLTQRGITDPDARLAEIGKIFDEATALSAVDFEKSQQALVSRILVQMRPSPTTQSASMLAHQTSIQWIDVHNHFISPQRDFTGVVSAALTMMDQIGIRKLIAMPTPNDGSHPGVDCESFSYALHLYPKRFAYLGGGSTLNIMLQQAGKQTSVSDSLKRQFKQKAEEILRQGATGFGEMAAHHLSLHGADHPYESVPANHPLLLVLADIAAEHDVPIDIHFDVVTKDMPDPNWLTSPNNPKILHVNLDAFEQFLDHNPKAKICWAHAGSDNIGHWTVDLSRRLLQKHPNLYMSLRLGPGYAPENFPLTPDRQIKPEWLQLLKDFPTRFVIGSDNFIAAASFHGTGTGAMLASRVPITRELVPAFLNALPADLARNIASDNAIALYKLRN